jgi:predicted RNA-binding Zn ribbon-like protein
MSHGMSERTVQAGRDGWKSVLGARISDFRREVLEDVARMCRGEGAADGFGLRAERHVQDIVNELGRALMREVFEAADTAAPEVTVSGERWGNRRATNGTYETTFGEVSLLRATYQRSGRGRVLIPLDLRLGMVEGRYTPLVARIGNRALASMPTDEGEALLKEIGVCSLSRSTLHRLPQAMLARVRDDMEVIEATVRASDAIPADACTMQVAMDGVMVPTEGEDAKPRGRKALTQEPARHEQRYGPKVPVLDCVGTDAPDTPDDDPTPAPASDTKGLAWREASVGTISFWDKEGEWLKTIYLGQMPSYRKLGLVARLEKEFAAVHQERPDLRVVLASDGALTQWEELRSMADRVLGDKPRTELLDFFHCAARLGTAAKAIWGTTEDATVTGEHWKTTLREKIHGATIVLKALEYQRSLATPAAAKEIAKSVAYITRHKKQGRLAYAAAKRDKLPIGTGVTEAAAKTLVSVRMKRSGARYSEHGGHTIITLRAALLSGRFEAFSDQVEATYTASVAA